MSGTWDIAGKTVVVTGGTTGIGRATVEELARRGASVIFTARNAADGDRAVAEIEQAVPDADVGHRELHLDDLESVRGFADGLNEELDQLHVLINNAGVSVTERRTTVSGHEMMFGVNHLGHFLLVERLRDLLVASAPARVVIVASGAHKFGPLDLDDLQSEHVKFGMRGGMLVYGRSKLANVLHANELARRLEGTGVTVNCLHPGFVRTRLARDTEATKFGERFVWPLLGRFARSPEDGARTSIWAACAPELDGVTGAYLEKEAVSEANDDGRDHATAAALWEASEELVSSDR